VYTNLGLVAHKVFKSLDIPAEDAVHSRDKFPESLMRVGLKLLNIIKYNVRFDGEPLFTLLHDEYAFRVPQGILDEAHFDFHTTEMVQLNPKVGLFA
jgi:hypothetical protein